MTLHSGLRGNLFVCHVTGAQKNNLVCFSLGRPIKKMVECFICGTKLKLKDFRKYAKEKMMPEVCNFCCKYGDNFKHQ